MNRAGFVIALLAVLVIALIFFPSIGAALRAPVVYVFGETAAGIIGGLASVGGLVGILVWFISWAVQHTPGGRPRGGQGASTASDPAPATVGPARDREAERKGSVHDDATRIASQVNDMTYDYRQQSPFRSAGVEGPLDLGSPESQEMSNRYRALIDEMTRQYRREMLPEVIRVRGALAEFGISDAQLNSVYQQPQTFEEMETVASRLCDMAGRLERTLS